jgi:hypothetical protein
MTCVRKYYWVPRLWQLRAAYMIPVCRDGMKGIEIPQNYVVKITRQNYPGPHLVPANWDHVNSPWPPNS